MCQTEEWTVGRLLQWTAEYLKRHGSDSPRLDAEVLLAEAVGCQRIELYTRFDTLVEEEARATFRQFVRQRAEGMPVAYLVGRREFYSLSFQVTPDVLIPRPETEFLVIALVDLARQLARQRPAGTPISICDVGTGSGIVAVCAAVHLPEAEVMAIDISPAALDIARANAREHGVEARIEFVPSDLFAAVPQSRRFDFVVSNPPYIGQRETGRLSPSLLKYEPREALVAGPDGMDVIRRLIPGAAQRLASGGHLLIEINPALEDEVYRLVAETPPLELATTVKDLARLPRVVRARRS